MNGSSFFAELQRRHVYRVGAMYAVAGWLLVQFATQVFPFFEISNAAVRWVVIAVAAGFPVALVLAWIFDLTPEGIVRTDAQSSVDAPAAAARQRGLDRKLNYLLGALLLLAIAYLVVGRGPLNGGSATRASGLDKSIAVLPFENLSDDRNNAYFTAGIQDEILTRLSGVADLKVISRTSTAKYASRPDNLRTVAAELGVATLLEGSVQRSGERVRVNVQLIEARSDTHLWAKSYDRDLKDAFAVESEISQDIADALKARLSPSEVAALAKSPTDSAAAYDLFLRAEYELQQAVDANREAGYRQAESLYRQALVLDPGFALAAARLAHAVLSRHWFFKPLLPPELTETRQIIDRALAQAPELAEGHVALGYYHYWVHRDYGSANAAFRRALALQPSNLQASAALAYIGRRQGDWTLALSGLAKALVLAPRDAQTLYEYGQTLNVLRRYDEARTAIAASLALDPSSNSARWFLSLNYLFGAGDAAAARSVFDGVAAERIVPTNQDRGDVIRLVNARVYPELFERHYDQALRLWDAVPTATAEQRIEKLAARVAIQTIAGRQQSAQPDCEALRDLLEPQAAARPDEASLLTGLSWALVCLGRGTEALRAARGAAELLPLSKDAYAGNYYLSGLAQIAAQTGQPDEALKIIVQLLSIPAGDTMSVQRLKLDPVWDPLRGDPRFLRLIADGEAQPRPVTNP